MKYKESENSEEVMSHESLVKETSTIVSTNVDNESLYKSIYKIIDLRIKILEDSLADLKNTFMQLKNLCNEGDD